MDSSATLGTNELSRELPESHSGDQTSQKGGTPVRSPINPAGNLGLIRNIQS